MSKENLVSLVIPSNDQEEIANAIQTLESKLFPHLLEITNDEKSALPKMKDRSLPFVRKVNDYAAQKPTLVPAYISVEEMKKDMEGVDTLKKFHNSLSQLVKALDDTMTVAGSEAYISALTFYNNVKAAAKLNVPGAQEIYEDLKVRFEVSTQKALSSKTTKV